MTAVIYARYSSDNQREESIEGQIRECTAYAEKNGITVIKHYIDRAFSAKTDNRPEFQQMIKDSGKKLFDVVLVWKFDRFARNRFDSANYKMILKKNGVHLISVMEPIAEGSQGILVETLLEGMAEYYSAELSEKVIRGQTENALKGKCTGGTGTIGYKIDGDRFYHLDPLTSPLVLEAFQRYDNGDKMVEIVNFLNDKGVRNMLGGKMTHSSVNTMLKNRRYIGELSFRDIVVPDAIPVIVPKDLFDRVQKRLDKNKRAPACGKADEEYLLTTKLFCGKCGALMFGESGTSATGRTYYYYKCANVKRRKGCNKKTVQKDWLEDLVVRETMKLIQDDAQDPHGDSDEKTLQEKPEQGAYIHLHQAGFQHRQANVVDTGVSGNDAAGIRHHLLCQVKDRHHNIKSIADEPDRHRRFEDPAHDEGRLKLCHVVVLGDHLDQFITGDKSQDDACNRQNNIQGKRFDHCKNTRFKGRWLCADLLCNVTDLLVHGIKQPGQVGHNACRQDAFDPVGNSFENGFHSAVTVL